MITIDSLGFSWPLSAALFRGFSLEIGRGQTWAILGSSGCGKTSLLTLIAGLHHPQEGEIRIDGNRVTRPRPRTGLILQDYGLLPWATVRENAALGFRLRAFYGPDGVHAPKVTTMPNKQDTTGEVDRWLARLDIAAIAGRYPAEISGGQRQRTAIARTLALGPDLLLMDEPFSSLDALTREDLQELTLELCREGGLTLVIVTHSIEEAVRVGSRILVLGSPPNREARVVDNSAFGKGLGTEYREACAELRGVLQSASGAGIRQEAMA
ncbi:MAG: ATP-binding cassette domain-containing protein [Spirochaetota bacterium]